MGTARADALKAWHGAPHTGCVLSAVTRPSGRVGCVRQGPAAEELQGVALVDATRLCVTPALGQGKGHTDLKSWTSTQCLGGLGGNQGPLWTPIRGAGQDI